MEHTLRPQQQQFSSSFTMKSYFALALLAAVVAAVSGQTEPWCRCAFFVTNSYAEVMVYELPEVPIDSCENSRACKTRCTTDLNASSDYGNLWYLLEDGQTTGQKICTLMRDHFIFFLHNRRVYGYYEVCGGAWQYANVMSEQLLCCEGGEQKHCIA
ncbi:uncharacterized protein LOC143034212 [Oratosquilla oratoria]|uniref:uncharacterized protein LOC143034212 n=1 Tax=Oratosquilla oratoria TaxID=337810 RepID=UPI003F775C42